MDEEEPVAVASFSIQMTDEDENWFLNLFLIVAPILGALAVGFLGPFDGWAAVLAAVAGGVLTYALMLGLWMLGTIAWLQLSSRWAGRQFRKSNERRRL